MYPSKPAFDYSFVHEDDMSVYGPKDHQRIISKLNTRLGMLYYVEGTMQLEPFPETMIDETRASPVPDLLLYDNETGESPIIVEVCHQEGLKLDLKKVARLVDEENYGVLEGFVYNYKSREWHQYRKGTGWVMDTPSYSSVLNLDLNEFL
ncbi:hypothetical protein [Spirosoma endophyticum]|uniref:Uncharacterized protein n=1 Tax=Spirosoma endophyticum TaxID=662367 RepID=A0A1I2F479_9BACT|nr:hypothetical protein [Spirosoma endophyticum]SFE99809.1 hypothetical protein SAMN05216167_12446 [Spirosoma endophyticum]